MPLKLATATHLLDVLEDLKRREPLFHRPEWGTQRSDFEDMTDGEFWEVGASGRCYGRAFILDTLDNRRAQRDLDVWETHGFHCQEIAPDNYLVTYTLHQGARVTRRATLWRRTNLGWKALYHQGTVVDAAA
jgi:hypothetical protein